MFIVHVVRQFHPGRGGLESVVLELASAQVKSGHRVRVVTLDRLFQAADRQRLPATDTHDGIEIVRIPYFGSTRYPIAFSALRHIEGADVVHVHAIDFFFDYLAWTKPIHGRTLVVSTHGGFFHTAYAARLKRLWFGTVTRLSMKFYAGVAAVSAFDFEQFRAIRPTGDGVHRKRRQSLQVPRCLGRDLAKIHRFLRPLCQEQADRLACRPSAGAAAP